MTGAREMERLLPQTGAMVLLDEILECDHRRIACRASSHRSPANPLQRDGVVPVWAGIEYAAQAMAAHFAKSAGGDESRVGLLGGLRDVVCTTDRLDNVEAALLVTAERLAHDPSGTIYAFAVRSEDDRRVLLQGRATVVHPAWTMP